MRDPDLPSKESPASRCPLPPERGHEASVTQLAEWFAPVFGIPRDYEVNSASTLPQRHATSIGTAWL